MAVPLLVSQNQNTQAEVGYVIGTDYTQIGDDLPIAGLETSSTTAFFMNRVIYAWGGVYCMHYDGLYKLQTGSNFGTWSSDSADGGIDFESFPSLGDIITPTGSHGGVYYTVIDNTPYLCGWIVDNTSSNSRVWRYNLLTSTPEAGSATSLPASFISSETFYNDKIYAILNSTTTAIFDPSTLTISSFSASGGPQGNDNDLCVYEDRIFAVGRNAGSNMAIFEIVGTAWFELFTLSTGSVDNTRRHTLFSDGSNMFVIYYNSTSGDWELRRLLNTAGVISLDATVLTLPTSLEDAISSSRFFANRVHNDDGTNSILIYHNINGSTGTWTQYLWDGTNLTATLKDQGGFTGYFSVPTSTNGSGDREYVEDVPTVCVYARDRVAGGERVTFRAFPPVNGVVEGLDTSDLVVRFYYNADQNLPVTQALLTGTATGGSATRSGNTVTGVDADGATDYTVIVQASGFSNNERISLVAEVSAT